MQASQKSINSIQTKLDNHYDLLVKVDKKVAVIESNLKQMNGNIQDIEKRESECRRTFDTRVNANKELISVLQNNVGQIHVKFTGLAVIATMVGSIIGGLIVYIFTHIIV